MLVGTPVVTFIPIYFGVSLLKLDSGKKGTLIINGFLGNLVWQPSELSGKDNKSTYIQVYMYMHAWSHS